MIPNRTGAQSLFFFFFFLLGLGSNRQPVLIEKTSRVRPDGQQHQPVKTTTDSFSLKAARPLHHLMCVRTRSSILGRRHPNKPKDPTALLARAMHPTIQLYMSTHVATSNGKSAMAAPLLRHCRRLHAASRWRIQ